MAKKSIQIFCDADYLAYSAPFAAQHTYYLLTDGDLATFGEFKNKKDLNAEVDKLVGQGIDGDKLQVWERLVVEPVENALHSVKFGLQKMISRIEDKFDRKAEMHVFLTGYHNYRDVVATIKPYKGNRNPFHRPRLYREARQYMIDVWNAKVVNFQEADDEVCIRQTEARRKKQPCIIAGIDKDLWQCPGNHYSANKNAFAKIGDKLGLALFYRQLVMGDSTDNIGGVYKGGEKLAKELITKGLSEQAMYELSLKAYVDSIDKYGERTGYSEMGAEAALIENARLLWMKRSEDEPLWVPPTQREAA